jgi:hypothetical protein
MTKLNSCTAEELQQALAGLLAHMQEEVLNDTEVQEFWQICHAIQQRCSRSWTAAWLQQRRVRNVRRNKEPS